MEIIENPLGGLIKWMVIRNGQTALVDPDYLNDFKIKFIIQEPAV